VSRPDHEPEQNRTITTDPATNPLAGISADTYEITAVFNTTTATAPSFVLRLGNDGKVSMSNGVYFDPDQHSRLGQHRHRRWKTSTGGFQLTGWS
jgi:hypothetical protein